MQPQPTLQFTARGGTFWLLAAVALLFVAMSVRYALKAGEDRSAFNRWRSQVQELADGVDLSARFNYPNPPVMAVMLEPLAHLPPVTGALVWYYLKAAMALAAIVWTFRLITPATGEGGEATAAAPPPLPLWAKALIVCLSLKPILDDLSHGNVNLLILFLVVACFVAFRRRRDLLAGGLLGLAVACKITPLLLVGYFVWKRSTRVLVGFALGIALFLYPGVVPALRLGLEGNQRQLLSWYQGMVRPYIVEGKVTSEHINQSLPGLAVRLLTDSPSFVNWENDTEVPVRFDNVASLSVEQVKWLVKGAMALFVVLVIVACRTPTEQRGSPRLAAELGIVVLGMLLFSERTWKHHAVTLLVPFAVLVAGLATARSQSRRLGLAALLVVAFALTLLPGLGNGKDRLEAALQPPFGKLMLVFGAYTAAFLVLLGGQAWLLLSAWGSAGGASSSGKGVPLAEMSGQAQAA